MSEAATIAPALKEIGDKLANLKITEAVALSKYLEDTYSIKPAAGGAVMMAAPAGSGGGEDKPAVQTEFTVHLDEIGANKTQVIKVAKEITGLSLMDAKKLVESAPKAIKENVAKAQAEELKKKLEEAGAKVSLK